MKTHGKRKTKEYEAWQHMKSRCLNPKDKWYSYYGGRGITVCDRWMKFEDFLEDMGEAPSKNHSLDRYPNYNGNYEQGNCRWATKKEQSDNREFSAKSISSAARKNGIGKEVAYQRIKRGMSIELAVSLPKQQGKRLEIEKLNSKENDGNKTKNIDWLRANDEVNALLNEDDKQNPQDGK